MNCSQRAAAAARLGLAASALLVVGMHLIRRAERQAAAPRILEAR